MIRCQRLLGCFLLALPLHAPAQYTDFSSRADMAMSIAMQQAATRSLMRSRELAFGEDQEKGDAATRFDPDGLSKEPSRSKSVRAVSTRFSPGQASRAPATIAANYPAERRAEVQRTFQELLTKYRDVERAMNVPSFDVAGAVAMFLSGSYEAYHDASLEPEQFKALVAQMRRVIGTSPDFARASNEDKQEMYEQMAILGMFMAATQDELSRKPNPKIAADMKQVARGYLEQFLKTDADRVHISSHGLVLR